MEIAISITKEDKSHQYTNTNESFKQNKTIIMSEIHEQIILTSHNLKREIHAFNEKRSNLFIQCFKEKSINCYSFL